VEDANRTASGKVDRDIGRKAGPRSGPLHRALPLLRGAIENKHQNVRTPSHYINTHIMMFANGNVITTILAIIAARVVEGLPVVIERDTYYHGGKVPVAGRVSYGIVMVIALPGLIWCLGES
jgi:hypothetical protein